MGLFNRKKKKAAAEAAAAAAAEKAAQEGQQSETSFSPHQAQSFPSSGQNRQGDVEDAVQYYRSLQANDMYSQNQQQRHNDSTPRSMQGGPTSWRDDASYPPTTTRSFRADTTPRSVGRGYSPQSERSHYDEDDAATLRGGGPFAKDRSASRYNTASVYDGDRYNSRETPRQQQRQSMVSEYRSDVSQQRFPGRAEANEGAYYSRFPDRQDEEPPNAAYPEQRVSLEHSDGTRVVVRGPGQRLTVTASQKDGRCVHVTTSGSHGNAVGAENEGGSPYHTRSEHRREDNAYAGICGCAPLAQRNNHSSDPFAVVTMPEAAPCNRGPYAACNCGGMCACHDRVTSGSRAAEATHYTEQKEASGTGGVGYQETVYTTTYPCYDPNCTGGASCHARHSALPSGSAQEVVHTSSQAGGFHLPNVHPSPGVQTRSPQTTTTTTTTYYNTQPPSASPGGAVLMHTQLNGVHAGQQLILDGGVASQPVVGGTRPFLVTQRAVPATLAGVPVVIPTGAAATTFSAPGTNYASPTVYLGSVRPRGGGGNFTPPLPGPGQVMATTYRALEY